MRPLCYQYRDGKSLVSVAMFAAAVAIFWSCSSTRSTRKSGDHDDRSDRKAVQ